MGRALAGFVALICLAQGAQADAADLSPATWSQAQRSELQAREFAFVPKAARESSGTILVTGTSSPIAVHAGMETLRQGGSAADAATVVALTQIATTMGGTVSYAGKLEVAYFDAKTGNVSFLDASWSPYAGENDPSSIPELGSNPTIGQIGRQTLVPGFMRGMEALHARFGRLRWAELFQPSIWYAENGVGASPAMMGFRENNDARFARTPEGRRRLRTADGGFPKMGELVRQPDLARTLRAVASRGADEMYRGSWARNYVATIQAYGGHATLKDLVRYRPRWRAPLQARFDGATVFGMSDGPLACASLTSLSLLDAMQVSSMGPYWKDPAAFRAYARAIQYAELRQYAPAGPTAFEQREGLASATCADRLAQPYAAKLAAELLKAEPLPFGEPTLTEPDAGHHTMAVVVVDRRGDLAVLVHSANGAQTGIIVGGVPIAEAASVNKAKLSGARAGDLLPNDMAPLIALRQGRPVAAVGGTAISLMPETVRLMAGMLSRPQDLAAITAAPPLLYKLTPPSSVRGFPDWPVLAPAGAYDPAFLTQLRALGISIEDVPRSEAWTDMRGTAAAAVIAPSNGVATAVEVPVLDYFVETER